MGKFDRAAGVVKQTGRVAWDSKNPGAPRPPSRIVAQVQTNPFSPLTVISYVSPED
jgi:hypothetical protein